MFDPNKTVDELIASLEETYAEFLTAEGFLDTPIVKLGFIKATLKTLSDFRDQFPSEIYDALWTKIRAMHKTQYKIVVDSLNPYKN